VSALPFDPSANNAKLSGDGMCCARFQALLLGESAPGGGFGAHGTGEDKEIEAVSEGCVLSNP